MNCQESSKLIDAFMIGALDSDQRRRLSGHIASCPDCSEKITASNQLIRSFKASADRRAASWRERIQIPVLNLSDSQLQEFPAKQKTRSAHHIQLVAAAVLAVLIGAGLLFRLCRPATPDRPAVEIAWIHEGGGTVSAKRSFPTLVSESRVFSFRHNTAGVYLSAHERKTGELLWEASLENSGPIAADDQHVYVLEPSAEYRLTAIRATDGKPVWQYRHTRLGSRFVLEPTLFIHNDALYWENGKEVVCIKQETGTLLWSRQFEEHSVRALSPGQGDRIFTVLNTGITALNASDGEMIWSCDHIFSEKIQAGPVWIDSEKDAVFLAYDNGEGGGKLICLDGKTGTSRWSRETGKPLNLTVLKDRVFLKTKGLDVFSASTGVALWSVDIQGCGPVSENKGIVYLVGGRAQKSVFAFDLQQGRNIWSFPLCSSCSGLAIVEQWGYFRGHDGLLYALKLNRRG